MSYLQSNLTLISSEIVASSFEISKSAALHAARYCSRHPAFNLGQFTDRYVDWSAVKEFLKSGPEVVNIAFTKCGIFVDGVLMPFGADKLKVHPIQNQYGPMGPLKHISEDERGKRGMELWLEENICFNAVAYGIYKTGEVNDRMTVSEYADFKLSEIPVEGEEYFWKFCKRILDAKWVAVPKKLLFRSSWYYYTDKIVEFEEYWYDRDGEQIVYTFKEEAYKNLYVKNNVGDHPWSPQLWGSNEAYNHNQFYTPITYGHPKKCWFSKKFVEDIDKQTFMMKRP